MSMNLHDLVTGAVAPEESIHRTKKHKDRPTEEVELKSFSKESFVVAKTQKDPTDDLVEYTKPLDASSMPTEGYLVWCAWSEQMWWAHSKLCLDQNFIYREDIDILDISNSDEPFTWYSEKTAGVEQGIYPSRKCYILDNPGNETYEVYHDSNYPSLHYGRSTPKGCFIHCYPNRFHRDMAILELDDLYTNSSLKEAAKLTEKNLGVDEAIIVSDGAWMKESCSSTFFYMDNMSVVKQTEGFLPTDGDQAVLIAEINGAYRALKMCMERQKRKIRYYYDNTSILNVFRNRKTEYIEEVKRYKDLLEKMDNYGYVIEFIELHPKTGEDRETDNRALQYFHNGCDMACREMCDIYSKDYKAFASADDKKGKTYSEFKKENAPKPRNQGNGYRKPGTNYRR